MAMDDERRKAFEEFYGTLSPEERRGRLFLKPEFRDDYNELVEADRQFPVPQYLWEKWVPAIGVFPVAVYLELRRMCFVNRATGERRDWCWPKQETIAKRLGVKKRQTVGEALRLLESHGFIRREKSYRRRGDALMQRGSDRYLVYFEIPLIAADAVELLFRRMAKAGPDSGGHVNGLTMDRGGEELELGARLEATALAVRDEPPGAAATENLAPPDTSAKRTDRSETDMSAKRTYRPETPDRSQKGTEPAVRKTDSGTMTRTITPNVTNVGTMSSGTGTPLRLHPLVQAMDARERAKREALAWEIGDSLATMAGTRDPGAHKSAGFHRRVAFLMPEELVRQALMATRDALEERRSGRGGLRSDPGAFFAGTVKELASQNGIDLGLRERTAEAPKPAPRRIEAKEPEDEERASPEQVRELLAGLYEKWGVDAAKPSR